MAAHSIATTLDPVDPTIRTAARELADRLEDDSEVGRVVRSMLTDVAHGAKVIVLRSEDEVTPAQAAEMLGVTRQFVDRLCEDEVLPFRRLPGSRHRRIRVQDVVDVAAEREQRRAGGDALRAALADLKA
nr:helix-turn-helix domain-containing protein [Propionicimonas sp.]